MQYILYSGAEANLAVALYGLSVQVSCLMVFTVHENYYTIRIYLHVHIYTCMTTSSLWLVFLSHSYIIDNPAFSNILPELFPETCKKLLRVQYTLCILYCSHMLITKCTCTCNSRLMVLQCMGYVPREGCMYFFGRSPRNYIQHKSTTIHTLHECRQESHNIDFSTST